MYDQWLDLGAHDAELYDCMLNIDLRQGHAQAIYFNPITPSALATISEYIHIIQGIFSWQHRDFEEI